MKIVYIGIWKNDAKPAVELTGALELTSYNYFTRGTVEQGIKFAATTIAERTPRNKQMDVLEKGSMFHVYSHNDPVCGCVVTDEEYPSHAGQAIVRKVVQEFVAKYPRTAYMDFTQGNAPLSFPELNEYIQKYQNPENADATMKIQRELDETKVVLHNTIQSVLERGEKIDNLVQKSEGLSAQSKMFYTQAKKQNSCCTVM